MADVIEIDPIVVDGPHGDVDARLYRPTGRCVAAFVWVHGGAFVFGDLDMPEADWVARVLASEGVIVLSVDHRKAVDGVRFPVPDDDVLACWRWAVEYRDRLGGAAVRLHLGGASAGANLSAGMAKRLRDGEGPAPSSLVLAYPLLHATLPPTSDELQRAVDNAPPEALMFHDDLVRHCSLNYVGDEARFGDPYAFPANGALEGLPPVLIVNSEYDTLRASGEAFAQALEAAGVEVRVECEPGTAHGHLNEAEFPPAMRTLHRMVGWLRDH
jgi:acetyl esterase